MPFNIVPSLDRVLQKSGNATDENVQFTFEGSTPGAIEIYNTTPTKVIALAVGAAPSTVAALDVASQLNLTIATNPILVLRTTFIEAYKDILPWSAGGPFDIGGAGAGQPFGDAYFSGTITAAGITPAAGDFVVNGNILMDGAASRTLYGGNATGDDLQLYANSVDTYPFITLAGAGDISIQWQDTKNLNLVQQGSAFGQINRTNILYSMANLIGAGFGVDNLTLTSGDAFRVRVDSDIVTTGKIINLYSGSTFSDSAFNIDKAGKIWINEDLTPLGGGLQIEHTNLQTVGAGANDLHTVSVAEGEVVNIEAMVVARKNDGTDRAALKFTACFYRNAAGNVTQEGANVFLMNIKSNALWSARFIADVGNQTIDLRIAGVAGDTIEWKAVVKYVKVE